MQAEPPSYFEIALTSRQVLGGFVFLLVALLAAFLAGVWIGRQGETATEAYATPGAAAPAGGEGDDAPRAEEFTFFRERPQRAEPGSPALEVAAARRETTLAEDVGGEPLAEGWREEPLDEEGSAPSSEAPAAPSGEIPITAEAAAASPTSAGLVVQVSSTPDEAQARKLVERLMAAGYPAFLSPHAAGGRTMHRVRIGPYADQAEAQAVAERVRGAFRLETWITR